MSSFDPETGYDWTQAEAPTDEDQDDHAAEYEARTLEIQAAVPDADRMFEDILGRRIEKLGDRYRAPFFEVSDWRDR